MRRCHTRPDENGQDDERRINNLRAIFERGYAIPKPAPAKGRGLSADSGRALAFEEVRAVLPKIVERRKLLVAGAGDEPPLAPGDVSQSAQHKTNPRLAGGVR